MQPNEIELCVFVTETARQPFVEWLERLDGVTRARVHARLNRVRLGNFGDCRSLGGGLHEMRLDFGPGHRAYFSRSKGDVVLLLGGGNKRSQSRDIARARARLRSHTRKESLRG